MKGNVLYNLSTRFLWPILHGSLSYMLILLYFNSLSQVNELFFSRELLFCIAVSAFNFESLLLVNKRLKKHNLKTNALRYVFSILLSVFVTSSLVISYFIYIENSKVYDTELLIFNSIFGLSTILIQSVILGLHFQSEHNKIRLLKQEEYKKNIHKKIKQFGYQTSPEFLFHKLEAILAHLPKSKQTAEKITIKTSQIYRWIIENNHQDLIRIDEELEIVKQLISLWQLCCYPNIQLRINEIKLPENLFIVPGSIFRITEKLLGSVLEKQIPINLELHIKENNLIVDFPNQMKLFSSENLSSMLKEMDSFTLKYSSQKHELSFLPNNTQIIIPLFIISEH